AALEPCSIIRLANDASPTVRTPTATMATARALAARAATAILAARLLKKLIRATIVRPGQPPQTAGPPSLSLETGGGPAQRTEVLDVVEPGGSAQERLKQSQN